MFDSLSTERPAIRGGLGLPVLDVVDRKNDQGREAIVLTVDTNGVNVVYRHHGTNHT